MILQESLMCRVANIYQQPSADQLLQGCPHGSIKFDPPCNVEVDDPKRPFYEDRCGQVVCKAFELKYGSQILKITKKRRNKKGVAVLPSIDNALKKRINSLYTPSILLRQSDLVRL